MRHTLLALLFIASGAWATPYDICIISDNPEPACFVLDTPLPKEDIIAVVEYPEGTTQINIAGVEVQLNCKDTNGDGFDDECLMGISAADSPYHPYGTDLAVVCSGTTLLLTKADGEGGTYTNSQMNSLQCGYVAPPDDPCFNGSWYIGYGKPECEDVDNVEYRLFCTEVYEEDFYGLAKRTTCPR